MMPTGEGEEINMHVLKMGRLSLSIRHALVLGGYATADEVRRATDEELLRITGIGPQWLLRIRDVAPAYSDKPSNVVNLHASRTDNPLQLAQLAQDLAAAAQALRSAKRSYRAALLNGDLSAAIKAKEAQLAAHVQREMARAMIEGADDADD